MAIRLAAARQSLAANLAVDPEALEFVSGTSTAFSLALNGLLTETSRPFIYGATDRRIPFAAASQFEKRGGRATKLLTDNSGQVKYSNASDPNSVVSWQSSNRETGVIQNESPHVGLVNADMTSGPFTPLPARWDTAVWEPASWGGPRGIGLLAIKNDQWRNPGAQISSYRTAPDYSIPLVLAAAIALEETLEKSNYQRIVQLHTLFVTTLRHIREDVIIAGEGSNRDLRKLSLVVPGIEAEEALRALEKGGFLVDSGSACITPELHPSAVLTEMGYSPHGNLRITFREIHSEEDCQELAKTIAQL